MRQYRLIKRRRAASAMPYTLMLGLVAVVALLGITQAGGAIASLFSATANRLGGVGNGANISTPIAPPADVTPDNFSFPPVSNQGLNQLVTSAAVVVGGFDVSLSASVSGGGSPQISVNGGGFTAGPQSIAAGQTIVVRLTSALTVSTPVSATVAIGGVTADFTVTTSASYGPFTFTSCGRTGDTVPSQSDCTSAYASTSLAGAVTVTAGLQSFTVPISGTYKIQAYGAQGGDGKPNASSVVAGALGGYSFGQKTLSQGEVIVIGVGQSGVDQALATVPYGNVNFTSGFNGGGFNGGGKVTNDSTNDGRPGGGGGASDLRQGGAALSNRIIVAGGGGGAGSQPPVDGNVAGGVGGGGSSNGGNSLHSSLVAEGGLSTRGGQFPFSTCSFTRLNNNDWGSDGVLGIGGNGDINDGGGGGGGYYGGAGSCVAAGGAGGSGYIGGVTSGGGSNGVRSGEGTVILTFCPGGVCP